MSKRIAIVIDPWDLPYNGTVVSARRFVHALESRGQQFRILYCTDSGQSNNQMRSQDETWDDLSADGHDRIVFKPVSIPGFNHIIQAMKVLLARPERIKVREALKGCSLLHVQFPFFLGYVAIQEAVKLGIPIVCSFHVQPENVLMNVGLRSRILSKFLYRIFLGQIYSKADLVIAPSPFAADLLREQGLKVPIQVLSNGVPDIFFDVDKEPSNLLQTTGNGKREFNILSVGRLSGEKQQGLLIAAIAQSKYKENIRLRLVGAGPNEYKLKTLLARSGIKGSIETVSDDELLRCHKEADLFVHCGEIELEGMSVVEAMAAGNVVLVSDSRDSASGHFALSEMSLFSARNVNDLSRKIDYWVEHDEMRVQQGKDNRRYIQQYNHADCVQLLSDIYEHVLLGDLGSLQGDGDYNPVNVSTRVEPLPQE